MMNLIVVTRMAEDMADLLMTAILAKIALSTVMRGDGAMKYDHLVAMSLAYVILFVVWYLF